MSALVDTTTRASEQNLSNLEKASVHDEKIHNDKHSTVTEVDALEADVRPEFDDPNLDKEAAITGILEDDSPYPEHPCLDTGVIWAIIIPGLNHFFFRYPCVTVTSIVAQLLTFPIGRAWGRFLPFGIAINPGPFSVKEHVLITIMACAGASSAYAIDIIWPYNLVTCALFNTLHAQQYSGVGSRGGYSREKFFYLVFAVFTEPEKSTRRSSLFGVRYGLAVGMVSFNWEITDIGSPLATPWWAEANIAVGFISFFWILTPAIYLPANIHLRLQTFLASCHHPCRCAPTRHTSPSRFRPPLSLNADVPDVQPAFKELGQATAVLHLPFRLAPARSHAHPTATTQAHSHPCGGDDKHREALGGQHKTEVRGTQQAAKDVRGVCKHRYVPTYAPVTTMHSRPKAHTLAAQGRHPG
ncbi:OPT oligopeptide transporter protein-domain-containing protein [Mycena rebaudengoi]|nr:OPT oligopeptide transporter protein-domain-containing protein [Mycena rebaudengoi]